MERRTREVKREREEMNEEVCDFRRGYNKKEVCIHTHVNINFFLYFSNKT
jgi:hypothetical protein